MHTSHSHLPFSVIHIPLFTAAIPQATRPTLQSSSAPRVAPRSSSTAAIYSCYSHVPFCVMHTSLFTAPIPHYSQPLFRRRRVLPSNLRARPALRLALLLRGDEGRQGQAPVQRSAVATRRDAGLGRARVGRCFHLGRGNSNSNLTWAIRAAKTKIPNLDSVGPIYKSLYVNPKESKGFTSGARQMNPGFTESRWWQ